MAKIRIGITMGDPSGIGPEIVLKALCRISEHEPEILNECAMTLYGNIDVLRKAASVCGINCEDVLSGKVAGIVDVPVGNTESGILSAASGRASFDFLKRAQEDCSNGIIDAIATAPINKEALKLASIPYIGHTEILAGLTNTCDPLTMFYVRGMKVFFLTRHIRFADIIKECTYEKLISYIVRCTDVLKKTGSSDKPFAVAALNPHGSDNGLFGDEEEKIIKPAIEKAAQMGINVCGPVPADSIFHMALKGSYSGVLSLYHDQGHIATKTLDFERTIAVTHGLPFLRTSVDHGTAYDIAGKGIASEVSMVEAIKVALILEKERISHEGT